MTDDHFASLMAAAGAGKKDKEGWQELPDSRHMTLYGACNGVSLTVSRVCAVKRDGDLIHARTVKGETYVLALDLLFAGAAESDQSSKRKAGFV
ncbi:MAG: hypothetical protein R3B13_22810 [Polyangiaceae bacterium]